MACAPMVGYHVPPNLFLFHLFLFQRTDHAERFVRSAFYGWTFRRLSQGVLAGNVPAVCVYVQCCTDMAGICSVRF